MQEAISIVHHGQVLRGMQHLPERAGRVPAVILFHGFTGTKLEPHRFFLKISRALAERGIASFRFDFLGSGESDGNFEDMTVLQELEQAQAILEYVRAHPAVDPEQITLLGFSLGGLVASLLGGDQPDSIQKLILLAPAGTFPQKAQTFADEARYIPELHAYDMGGNLVGQAFIAEAAQIEVWKRAAAFSGEVLLVHGTADAAVPFEVSSLYIANCYRERATLHVVAGADHTFNAFVWEQDVLGAICRFLTQ